MPAFRDDIAVRRSKPRFPALAALFLTSALIAGCQIAPAAAPANPLSAMSGEITRLLADSQQLAIDPVVDAQLASIAADGRRAIANADQDEASAQIETLRSLDARLAQEYDLRIVVRPGENTGLWRQSYDNPQLRYFYIVVEPVGPGGRILQTPITSIEDQSTKMVSKWAQRVSKETYDTLAAEKKATGLIADGILGHKARGELEPRFAAPTPGGAITNWDN